MYTTDNQSLFATENTEVTEFYQNILKTPSKWRLRRLDFRIFRAFRGQKSKIN